MDVVKTAVLANIVSLSNTPSGFVKMRIILHAQRMAFGFAKIPWITKLKIF